MSDVIEPVTAHEAATPTRRDHILMAAAACFARSGFHGTSMHEICQEARMSPGALYRYFRSKDEIIIAIAEEDRARNLAMLSRPVEGVSFVEHVIQLGMTFLTEMAEPGEAALMAEVMAEGLRNSEIGKCFKVNEDECKAIFHDLMEKAISNGEVEAPADFQMAMTCLMAMGEGLVIRMATDPSLTPARLEPILRQVVTGLFKPKAG